MKEWFVWCLVFIAITGILSVLWLLWFANDWFYKQAHQVADTAVIKYEEFQEIYNTTSKIDTDICNMQSIPDDDVMFKQFSKAQQVNWLKTNLNKWVEDYNAKSKMRTRDLWKSNTLPHQLSLSQFNCFNSWLQR